MFYENEIRAIHPSESVIQTIYDIVKAHGGELSVRTPLEKVETLPADLSDPNVVKAEAAAQAGKEGEGSKFTMLLPVL